LEKKIIVWNTSEKKRLKYPNQTDEFGSDSFLKNTKSRTKPNQSNIHWFGHRIHSKPIQTGQITPLVKNIVIMYGCWLVVVYG
jgi:hypothetical protein